MMFVRSALLHFALGCGTALGQATSDSASLMQETMMFAHELSTQKFKDGEEGVLMQAAIGKVEVDPLNNWFDEEDEPSQAGEF